ncbi:Dabb family protein [Serpentinicella alkaliphila]|uniref:Stress responsive alpha/beta barrel protein n=1 Tax=Serpentinicella alkaliphila TaxID=1734049 RepID=A0A4R2TTE2_9FIRM|nr:Dabb family protein [Serpentinicella alkaliphila]QUH25593.1 Dabb family protein [Serpentinicella alkaliphila]TCP98372.1 stress responsive alpha/beta barrel protein [Serpentinicella alkaliphila]
MLKHIIMWRIKDNVHGLSKFESAIKMKDALEGLVGIITEIKTLEVGININDSDSAYDIVLFSEFEDKSGLEAYKIHPQHMKVVELAKTIVSERAVVDYIV